MKKEKIRKTKEKDQKKRKKTRAGTFVIFHPFSFLWSCRWSEGDTFSNIFQMYINKCKRLGATVVVFDSYEASTKDATHNVRSGKMSKAVKIITENSCSFDCAEFLINYANKQRFVNDLQEALRLKEFETVLCISDADNAIVRTALETQSEQDTILADDSFFFSFCIMYFFPKVKRKYT